MALDKLVDSSQLDENLTSVANAIRTKGGTSASLAFPQGFVDAVSAIQTGGGGGETGDGQMPVGDFLIRHWKTVTIGENTVKNGAELLTYFYNAIGVSSMPPLFYFAGVNKESVAKGYVAACGLGLDGTTQFRGYRFRDKWEFFPMTTVYECSAFVGDQYLVYWYELVSQ